jgi:hypothetical protein
MVGGAYEKDLMLGPQGADLDETLLNKLNIVLVDVACHPREKTVHLVKEDDRRRIVLGPLEDLG